VNAETQNKPRLTMAGRVEAMSRLMDAWEAGEVFQNLTREQMNQKVLDLLEHGEIALLEPEGSA
jgi:hypothetical protein